MAVQGSGGRSDIKCIQSKDTTNSNERERLRYY